MKTSTRLLLAVMGFAALGATGASAADLGAGPSLKDTPVYDSGRGWMVRGRMLWIVPDAKVGPYTESSISNEVVPELDISYFFNRNLAVELILGTSKHSVSTGAAAGDIGNVWLLPPTLTLQYHFDLNSTIKPYIGAGVNYTIFYGEQGALKTTYKGLDNTFGLAAQVGVDIKIAGPWYANIDVKKLWLDTDTKAGNVKVDIDPWIVGVGIGYRFGTSPDPLK